MTWNLSRRSLLLLQVESDMMCWLKLQKIQRKIITSEVKTWSPKPNMK